MDEQPSQSPATGSDEWRCHAPPSRVKEWKTLLILLVSLGIISTAWYCAAHPHVKPTIPSSPAKHE